MESDRVQLSRDDEQVNGGMDDCHADGEEQHTLQRQDFPSLTQDCVAWDESNNLDLRDIVSPPERNRLRDDEESTPRTTVSRKQRERKWRRRRKSSLSSVTKVLPSTITIAKSPQQLRRDAETEIGAIFSRLQDEHIDGTADLNEPTQEASNTAQNASFSRNMDSKHIVDHSLPVQPRRRHTGDSIHEDWKRPKVTPTIVPGATRSLGNGPSPEFLRTFGTPKTGNDGLALLENLLQQVQTPSPKNSSSITVNVPCTIGTSNKANDSAPVPAEPKSQTRDAISSSSIPSQPNTSISSNVAYEASTTATSKINCGTPSDEFGDLDLNLIDALMSDSLSTKPILTLQKEALEPENAAHSTSAPLQVSASGASIPTVTTKETHVSPKDSILTNSEKAIPNCNTADQHPVKTKMSVPPETAVLQINKFEFGDEFGDWNMSVEDMDEIESIMLAGTQAPFDCRPLRQGVPMNGMSAKILPRPEQLAENVAKDIDTDPFGDFPEVDFEELDKTIAAHQTHSQPTNLTLHTCVKVQSLTLYDQHPHSRPAIAPVINPLSITQEAPGELHHLSFTRYKVLQVFEDTTTFTKTLSLASWQTSMLREDIRRTWHLDDRCTSDAAWPEAGLVHLRGEWYHTRITTGDVIHICSLTGRFRTDTLPLILHTCPPPGSVEDDLVIVVHPDMLLTPTCISETVSCTRRAVLKSRLGSSGLTGTYRPSV
jgi:hypothetical protein